MEAFDNGIDNPDKVIFVDPVFQTLWKERCPISANALDETAMPTSQPSGNEA